jgi:hypothetical protein
VARELATATGDSLDKAEADVATTYLYEGHLEPVQDLLLENAILPENLRTLLALMLAPERLEAEVPFRLVAKRMTSASGAKRRPDAAYAVELAAREVAILYRLYGPGSYASAIKEVAEARAIGEKTLRNAYDQAYGTRARDGRK